MGVMLSDHPKVKSAMVKCRECPRVFRAVIDSDTYRKGVCRYCARDEKGER